MLTASYIFTHHAYPLKILGQPLAAEDTCECLAAENDKRPHDVDIGWLMT